MKIAFLTPEFPHPRTGNSGGIGSSIANLAKGLTLSGHKVTVVVYGQSTDEVFADDGIEFHRVKNPKLKGLSWWLLRKKLQKLVNRLHAQNKVDLVEAPDWTGIASHLKLKCRLVVRLHGSDTYFCHLDKRPVKPRNFNFERRALLNADGLLSVSRYTAQVTQKLFGIKRDFTIIPNAVDTGLFTPSHSAGSREILYFGTLIRKKGLLELPHIFNKVIEKFPDARLTLVGKDAGDIVSGSNSTWALMLPMFSEKAMKNVEYAGAVAYAEMASRIADAAVCVFPTFAEALPVSWIEAMAMEKAIVASDIGWAAEIITDGSDGFLAPPNEHESFADKIVTLLQDETLRRAMGKTARQTVCRKFDTTVVAQQNAEYYQSLLQTK